MISGPYYLADAYCYVGAASSPTGAKVTNVQHGRKEIVLVTAMQGLKPRTLELVATLPVEDIW